MAMIRAVLRTHPSPEDPPVVLRHINEHFRYLWDTAIFATAVYGVLDANRLTLHLSCAGHPPPLLARRGGQVSELPVDSVIPLFIDDIRDVPCTRHALQPGDRIVVFTDGITDRQSSAGTMYDEAQLKSAIANAGVVSAATLVARLVDELDGFAGGQEPADDQTLLVVGVEADNDQGAAVPS
jgi:sigma-B regulation protein RsbU (phosphoserine phosphatase)